MKEEIIESIVDKIQQLPFENNFTIANLAENCNEKDLEYIAAKVLDRVTEFGIILKSVYGGNQKVGLLQNIPFFKVPN